MAQSRVPMTLRDPFFDDPFFQKSWDDFETVRENMFRESREMWKRFEEEVGKMENNMFSNMNQSFGSEKKEMVNETTEKESKKDDQNNSFGWMMPRPWMMPSLFNRDNFKQLNMFNNKDSEVIRVKDDNDKFEISLDTSQYRPDELRVNVGEGTISVEGKHEEKSEDGRRMVLKQFSRKYSLPPTAKQEKVVSNLSQDGVLVITAPKAESIDNQNRNVPITQK